MNDSPKRLSSLLIAAVLISLFSNAIHAATRENPNVIIIFLDDSGYSDFQPFGDTPYPTPNVHTLAMEGTRFTNFHVPQAVCSASRSALITGCIPGRTKMFGAHGPNAKGLDPKFSTMGELFQKNGYATGHFGKWHLGDQEETRPHNRGFDETAGLMYSNDMWEFHPENPEHWGKFPLQYWENGKVTIDRVTHEHQKNLTKWVTENSVSFIDRHKDESFFLYVAHPMPHVPIYASDEFEGKSGAGLYGDVIMELDWSVGEITKALRRNRLNRNTIVIFSSDNGPWVSYGDHAGSTPFREAKSTGFSGGTQSATIIKWPAKLKAGTVSNKALSTIDLLPTLCHVTGTQLPEHEIDGMNQWDILSGKKGAKNPQRYYPISTGKSFDGLITGDGKWKLHLPHSYRHLATDGGNGQAGNYETLEIELSLFDLENDPYESKNVIDQHPEIAAELQAIAQTHKQTYFSKKKK